jgi:hypothetical protein
MGEGRSHLFDPMEIAEDGDRRALSPPRVRVGRGSASRLASACLPPHVRRHMLTVVSLLASNSKRERESGEDGGGEQTAEHAHTQQVQTAERRKRLVKGRHVRRGSH